MPTLPIEIDANFPNDPVRIGLAFHRDLLAAVQQVKDALRGHYADRCDEAVTALLSSPGPMTALDEFHVTLATDFATVCRRRIGGKVRPTADEKRRQTLARVRRYRERKRAERQAGLTAATLWVRSAAEISSEFGLAR